LNAIENRVLGFVANDPTIIEVFEKGRCPYLSFGCVLYNKTYEELEKAYKSNDPEAKLMRQNSKPAVLGAGYMLSAGEEIVTEAGDKIYTGLMGYARNMGIELPQELADRSIQAFRDKHTGVVKCWANLENAAMRCISTRQPQKVGYIIFTMVENVLCCWLPSGRALHYVDARIVEREWFGKTKKTIECIGMNQKTHTFGYIYTYGGKLIENIVQAISRDILVNGMLEAKKIGFDIIMHCHDEIVAEVLKSLSLSIKDLQRCMIQKPWWADDKLFLAAEGFESLVYKKE
jgi:DNA polymerase